MKLGERLAGAVVRRNLLFWKKEPQETSLILIAFLRQVGRVHWTQHIVTYVLGMYGHWNLWLVTHNEAAGKVVN